MFKVAFRSFVLVFFTSACAMLGQVPPTLIPTSIDAHLLLEAASPAQRQTLKAIYLIECPPASIAGTGFVLDSGVLVTNSHVVATCDETNLIAITPADQQITFVRVIKDPARDLAVLVPKNAMAHGLRLAKKDNPEPGTPVATWGYPLLYNGTTPLLSVGYVSGFRCAAFQDGKPEVKRIVVNGAFNHGNSGGPLLNSQSEEVIGVVVMTFHFYPAQVRLFIDTLLKSRGGYSEWSFKKADGTEVQLLEPQLTGLVLDEFYQKTQVMIGEAVSGSELKGMLKEHSSELVRKTTQ